MKRFTFSCAIVALAALIFPLGAHAKTNAVPGGANQAAGVEVTYPATVFNGFVRIKPRYFGPPRSGKDNIVETPADGQQVLVFEGVITNGRTTEYLDDPSILLSDADGITADTRSIEPNGIILQQAAGAKLYVVFWAPKDFVPDHIVFSCRTAKCKPIRIKFKH